MMMFWKIFTFLLIQLASWRAGRVGHLAEEAFEGASLKEERDTVSREVQKSSCKSAFNSKDQI